jgi:hypothetical protein
MHCVGYCFACTEHITPLRNEALTAKLFLSKTTKATGQVMPGLNG